MTLDHPTAFVSTGELPEEGDSVVLLIHIDFITRRSRVRIPPPLPTKGPE